MSMHGERGAKGGGDFNPVPCGGCRDVNTLETLRFKPLDSFSFPFLIKNVIDIRSLTTSIDEEPPSASFFVFQPFWNPKWFLQTKCHIKKKCPRRVGTKRV